MFLEAIILDFISFTWHNCSVYCFHRIMFHLTQFRNVTCVTLFSIVLFCRFKKHLVLFNIAFVG
jgi:hypothetical protein